MADKIHDFDEDVLAGNELENFLIHDINLKRGLEFYKYHPNNGDYDLFSNVIDKGIECKNDLQGAKHPNICIEFGQSNVNDYIIKPSGLLVTKAEYWIHDNQTNLYLAHTDRIKKIFDWYNELEKNRLISITDPLLKENELVRKMNEWDNKKMGIHILYKFRKKQKYGAKLMNLFIIPEIVFRKICLEVATRNDMTYNKII